MSVPNFVQLTALVLAASGLAACTTCEESESTTLVQIPDAPCSAGRCEEWRSAPCEKTCAAFLSDRALEVTGCEPPRREPEQPNRLIVECRHITQTCTTSPSFGSGRPQADHLARGPVAGADRIGRFFATAAEAEESSVHAFHELGLVLEAVDAPASLVARCRAAAEDEERHRVIMTELARARGAEPSRAAPAPSRWPTLEALAIDNAAIGCVEELWSAALVAHAAHLASDGAIRSAMSGVARDEARHAALACAIDTCLRARLDAGALARLAGARRRAVTRLAIEALRVHDNDALVAAGLVPTRAARRRLLEALFANELSEDAACAA